MSPLDELDVIRALDGPVGGPDPAIASRVRARALARIAELDPSFVTGELTGHTEAARPRAPVIDLKVAGPASAATSDRCKPRSKAPLAAVAALMALLLVGVIATIRGSTAQHVQSRLPERSVEDLVRLAGSHPDRPIGPGELLFRRTIVGRPEYEGDIEVRDAWILPLDAGYEHSQLVESPAVVPPVPADPVGRLSTNRGPFVGYSYEQVRAMPVTAAALEDHLREVHSEMSGSDGAALALADVAALTVAPPGVRAAAVEVILQHGRASGESTDPLGRRGLLFLGGDTDAVAEQRGWAVLIDPITGLPLAVAVGAPASPAFSWDQAMTWIAFGPQEIRSA